jgi:hypothetical protein
VRNYSDAENPENVYVVGGFLGELILAFNAMHQCISTKNPDAQFEFGSEVIQKWLTDIMDDYPEGTIMIETHVTFDADTDIQTKAELAVWKLLDPHNQAFTSFGQSVFVDYATRKCEKRVLHDVLKAICAIHFTELKPLLPEPQEGAEGYEQQLAEVRSKNEEINAENQRIQAL